MPIRPVIDAAGTPPVDSGPTALSALPGPAPLDVPTYKRAAYDLLRDMIVWFEIAPGQRLVESELAGRLGVSKTPVREALALLEADGLVESTPYRGASVRWLTVTEMEEQAFLVDALEVPAFPLVVEHITRAEIAEVGDLIERMKQARRAHDQRAYANALIQMHGALFQPTGFPRLRSLIATVVGPVGLRYDIALVYPFHDAWDLHLRLTVGRFEALRRRDAEGAQAIVRRIRAELTELARSRMESPEIARYFKAA